jgi:pyruvate dehydrogenase E2 component (dihydrolipoamide acetyltransferase)
VATPVSMPQLGETVVEGTIIKWLKGEGDKVDRDEPLFEISTDKVDTEVPSPVAGVISEIKIQEGQTVSVGTELAVIDEEGGSAGGDGQAAQAEAPVPEQQPPEEPTKKQKAEKPREKAPARVAAPAPAPR